MKNVDFGPDGAWFVNGVKPDGTSDHSWWGGMQYADDQIKEYVKTRVVSSKLALERIIGGKRHLPLYTEEMDFGCQLN